jgi:hypothetical protein
MYLKIVEVTAKVLLGTKNIDALEAPTFTVAAQRGICTCTHPHFTPKNHFLNLLFFYYTTKKPR